MKVYTRKGDKGQTDLFDLKTHKKVRVIKSDPRLEVIGTIDELNSLLGVIKVKLEKKKDKELITKIQTDLQNLNSVIAGVKVAFTKARVTFLEREINKVDKKLPKLTHFVLPGNNETEAYLHLARSICRKGERRLIGIMKSKNMGALNNCGSYLNRLSDYLFILARGVLVGYSHVIDDSIFKL